MTAKKISPNRRRSIAVTNQNQHSIVPKARRRAHSIVPGALSPLAKARRSLAPRKSILKASVNTSNEHSLSQPQPTANSQLAEDGNITRSMEITREYTTPVHDNTSRKSLGRRVSWATHSNVLLFEANHTNSTSSSRESASPDITNENDYPGKSLRQRRSSARYSLAPSEDMDLTSVVPGAFQPQGSAILDEDFGDFDDEDDYDDVDMDVTEAIHGDFARKRSLSLGIRQPFSQIPAPKSHDADQSQLDIGNESAQSDATSEQFQAMEFTVPLGQSLRPANQDQVWLALKQATHSGNNTSETELPSDDEMDLDDAMLRLRHARDSMSLAQLNMGQKPQDDSFATTNDSFEDDGNQTMNVSQAFGHASMGQGGSRPSMGYQDSNMDESEVYGSIEPGNPTRQSIAPSVSMVQPPVPQQPPESPVFQPLPSKEASKQPITRSIGEATVSVPFSFTPKTVSQAFGHARVGQGNSRPSMGYQDSNMDESEVYGSIEKPTRQSIALSTSIVQPPVPQQPPESPIFQPPPSKEASKQPVTHSIGEATVPVPFSFTPKTVSQAFGRARMGQGGSRPSMGFQDSNMDESKVYGSIEPGNPTRQSIAPSASIVQPPVPQKPPNSLVFQPPPSKEASKQPATRSFGEATVSIPFAPTPATSSPSEPKPQEIRELSRTVGFDVHATQQWREGVQQNDQYGEDEVTISVAQFFSMTGIKFMDEITAPRRSIHPSQQHSQQPRNVSEIPLSEYVTAMAIEIPQLVLYSRVSKDLEGWMAKRKTVFAQVEEEAAKATPELFIEYIKTDEEGQAELLHQLNLIRTNTRYSARSDWYEWKSQWVEGLQVTAEEAFKSLENDARTLEELIGYTDGLTPELEQEYQRLTEELAQEQAEVAEIEGGDQDYLNELKATVAEQNIEIEALKAELSEGKDQLRWLQERAEELDAQKSESKNKIATAEQILHRKKNSTRSEIFRMKAELEALEELHMFRITKVNADLFEYVYASLFHVSIPCKNFIPTLSAVSITRFNKASTRYKDDFPKLSAFLLKTAQWLISEGDETTVREIVHCLADYWSSCAQLRSQLILLNIKYPVEIIAPPLSTENPVPHFEARTMVLFPSVMGKAFISFVFSLDTFRQWPTSIDALDCKVELGYGPLDRSTIMKTVIERLSQASPSDNYACLLDACIAAQHVYL